LRGSLRPRVADRRESSRADLEHVSRAPSGRDRRAAARARRDRRTLPM
jgi:hypothetical protein